MTPKRVLSALGRIRTCDLSIRSRALYPLSYEGLVLPVGVDPTLAPCKRAVQAADGSMVCVEGFEPTQPEGNGFTDRPGSPTPAHAHV